MGTIWPPDLQTVSGPKYAAVLSSLRDAIANHELQVGDRLPPVRNLAWELGVTPGTIARAYRRGIEEGILNAETGRGTFVAQRRGLDANAMQPSIILRTSSGHADLRGCTTPIFEQHEQIQQALKRLSQDPNFSFIGHPTPYEEKEAQNAVVHWLQYTDVNPQVEDITLTYGAQNAVLVALQAILTGPSPLIVTDELVFPGMRYSARLLRAQIMSVERDENGILPDAFENICRTHSPQVLLTSTNVHNPTTQSTTLERKIRLAEIARRYDIQIIDDDAYGIFEAETPSLKCIAPERTWYIGSLSKSVAAGLRFGYLIAPRGLGQTARSIMQSSCYGMSKVLVDLCTDLIMNGIAGKVRKQTQNFNAKRVKQAVNLLGSWDIAWNENTPFIWLRMPVGWRSSSFQRECEKNSILVRPADEFALVDGKAPNAVRLSIFAQGSDEEFQKAYSKIAAILRTQADHSEI